MAKLHCVEQRDRGEVSGKEAPSDPQSSHVHGEQSAVQSELYIIPECAISINQMEREGKIGGKLNPEIKVGSLVLLF